jgi:hypothetical protein
MEGTPPRKRATFLLGASLVVLVSLGACGGGGAGQEEPPAEPAETAVEEDD